MRKHRTARGRRTISIPLRSDTLASRVLAQHLALALVVLADLLAAGRRDGLGVLELVSLLLCRALAAVVLCLLLPRVLLGLLLRVLLVGRVGHVVGGLDQVSSAVCLSRE